MKQGSRERVVGQFECGSAILPLTLFACPPHNAPGDR
jgi:hypothetical protein